MIIEQKTIHSFSSEDPSFPAKNLLELKTSKRWKINAGEKQGFVVFKLKSPMIISGIDVGNEHSAFVEVFVANSKIVPLDYKEIMFTSSLMTPTESKESSFPNRVRCFSGEAFVDVVAKEKWDLIKFVCTQPFNKHVKFGLAFVTIHTPSDEKKDEIPWTPEPMKKSPEKVVQFGRFRLKSDSEDDDVPTRSSGGSVFQKWKETRLSASKEKTDMKSKLEVIKEAEKHKKRSFKVDSSDEEELQTKKMNRNRVGLMYDDEDDLPNEKMEKKMQLAKEAEQKNNKSSSTARSSSPPKSSSNRDKPSTPKASSSNSRNRSRSPDRSSRKRLSRSSSPKSSSKRQKTDSPKSSASKSRNRSKSPSSSQKSSKSPSRTSSKSPNKSTRNSSKSPAKPTKDASPARKVSYKPFRKLFDGVVFVISGIQNPERAEMRQKALDMGARYKQDWGSGCTHLICAFKNTPKYREVKGEGKIVSKNWIGKCHSERKRLSWRKFALDDSDREHSDSEGEIFDEKMKPAAKSPEKPRSNKKIIYSSDEDMEIVEKPIPKMSLLSSDDEDMNVVIKTKKPAENGDTEDVEKVKEQEVEETESLEEAGKEKETEKDPDEKEKEAENEKEKGKESSEDLDKTPELHFGDLTDEEQSILRPHNLEYTQIDNGKKIFDDKTFYLNYDLSATDKIKFDRYINYLKGSIVDSIGKADYVISNNARKVSSDKLRGEIVKSLWIEECYELENWIPTARYKLSQ